MNSQDHIRNCQVRDLISDTFHSGRKGNAVVKDSLCSHPEILGGEGWFGFVCWQRRPDGLYRRVQSTRVDRRGWGGYDKRTTFLGAWVERFAADQKGIAA